MKKAAVNFLKKYFLTISTEQKNSTIVSGFCIFKQLISFSAAGLICTVRIGCKILITSLLLDKFHNIQQLSDYKL